MGLWQSPQLIALQLPLMPQARHHTTFKLSVQVVPTLSFAHEWHTRLPGPMDEAHNTVEGHKTEWPRDQEVQSALKSSAIPIFKRGGGKYPADVHANEESDGGNDGFHHWYAYNTSRCHMLGDKKWEAGSASHNARLEVAG